MAVEIINSIDQVRHFVKCDKCLTLLKFESKDIYEDDFYTHLIKCPKCNNELILNESKLEIR